MRRDVYKSLILTFDGILSDVRGFHVNCRMDRLESSITDYDHDGKIIGCKDIFCSPNGLTSTVDMADWVFGSENPLLASVSSKIDPGFSFENVDVLLTAHMPSGAISCTTVPEIIQV